MNGEQIFQGLVARGLSPEHAAIVAGNAEQESSFNPQAWNPKEKAGGLIQWRKDRLANLLSFAKKAKKPPGDTELQLDFLVHEMTVGSEKTAGSKFLKAKTPEQMNEALKGYIRYGDDSQQVRFNNAMKYIKTPAAAPAPAAPMAGNKVKVNPAGVGSTGQAEFDESALDAFMTAGDAAEAPADATTPQAAAPGVAAPEAVEAPAKAAASAGAGLDLSDDALDAFMTAGEPEAATEKPKGESSPAQAGTTTIGKTTEGQQQAPTAPAPIPQKSNIAWKGDPGQTEADLKKQATGGNSILQGATLGAADEIGAAIAAPILSAKNMLTGEGPTSLGTNYAEASERARSMLAREQELAPITAMGLEIFGGVLTGGEGAAKTGAVQVVRNAPTIVNKLIQAGKLVGTGAASGAAYGFNTGEGMEDRVERAKIGAATGAIAGAAAPAAVKTGIFTAQKLRNTVRALDPFLGKFGEKRIAQRIVSKELDGGNPMAAAGEIIPGSTPTLAETSDNANVALLQRQARDANPELFVSRETAQNDARAAFLGTLRGTEDDINALTKQLDDQADSDILAAFGQAQPVDASPVVGVIDKVLSGPSGGSSAIQDTIGKLRTKLVDKDGNLVSADPEYLYQSVRKEIGLLMDKAVTPQGKYAQGELIAVRKALDDVIESGAPGFKQYLADYAAAAKPINGLRHLQSLDLFKNVEGNKVLDLSKVENALKKIEKQRRERGLNPAKDLTKDQITALEALRNDLLRSQKKDLGRSRGSNTSQNLTAKDFLENALPFGGKLLSQRDPQQIGRALGAGAGYLIASPTGIGGIGGGVAGAAVGDVIGRGVGKLMQRKNAKVMEEVENLLLHPANVRRGGKNLDGNKLSRFMVKGSTVGGANLLLNGPPK